MNKRVLLAATSMVLVSLVTSCGKTPTSESTSQTPEPTRREIFDSIEMFQGGLEKLDFIVKTKQIAETTELAQSRTRVYHYEEGAMGSVFNMEEEFGYTKFEGTTVCKLYGSNEVIDCAADSVTHKSTSETPIVGKGTQQTYAVGNMVYSIVDDGTTSYGIPENYRYVREKAPTDPLSNYISLALNENSFPSLFYLTPGFILGKTFNTEIDKLYTVKEGGSTTLHYLSYEEPVDYPGHEILYGVSATFEDDADRVVSSGVLYEYWAYGELVFRQQITYSVEYGANGAFTGSFLDPSKYIDLGTMIPEVEEGEYHDDAETYLDYLVQAAAGTIEYVAPTSSEQGHYIYNDLERQRSEMYEKTITELYENDVILMSISGETTEDKYAYDIQLTADDDNVYEVVVGHPEDGDYKVVTPVVAGEGTIFDLRDYKTIELMVKELEACKNDDESVTCAMTAGELILDGYTPEEGAELVYVTLQSAQQQSESADGLVIGSLFTIEIAFEITKDETGNVTSLTLIYTYILIDGQYDWEAFYTEEVVTEYDYTELGNAKNVLDPNNFEVLR